MCDHCDHARTILARGAYLPVAREHLQLMIRQCAQREAQRRAREAGHWEPPAHDADPAWVSAVGLLLLLGVLAAGWVVLR